MLSCVWFGTDYCHQNECFGCILLQTTWSNRMNHISSVEAGSTWSIEWKESKWCRNEGEDGGDEENRRISRGEGSHRSVHSFLVFGANEKGSISYGDAE